jgi:hypothetical protein
VVLLLVVLDLFEAVSAGVDGLVETGDLGDDVQLVAPPGIDFALGPDGLLFAGGSPLPPAGGALGVMFGSLSGGAGLFEVAHSLAGLAVVVYASAAFEVGSGVQSVTEVGLGGEDGLSQVRCWYVGGGLARDRGFGRE